MIVSTLLTTIRDWLTWPWSVVAVIGTATAIAVKVFGTAIWLLLIYFTARRRSNIAKWIVVGPLALALLMWPFYIETLRSMSLLSWLELAAYAVAGGLLFTPASRRWFKKDLVPVGT